MRKFIIGIVLAFLFISPAVAQDKEVEVLTRSWPEPYSVSHNIVFIVDASSTINRYPLIKKKFDMGWSFLSQQFAGDALYFRVYVFHDQYSERRTKWVEAGGPAGEKQFRRAKRWIETNTGIRSWGLKAIRTAIRDKNPLDRNPATARRLTIVIFTDGGLSEAAGYVNPDAEKETLKSTLKDHTYGFTGSYSVVDKMIAQEQKIRELKDLEPATIVTIGFENKEADAEFGMGVKQRDPECQAWLLKLGKRYRGGNFLIRMKQ